MSETIYNVDKSNAPSVVATVARRQIFAIIQSAILYTNYEDALQPGQIPSGYTVDRLNDNKFELKKNLLSFFYPDLRLPGLPSVQTQILNAITQKVLDKTRELKLYQLYADEPKQKVLMQKILQDITVEWADQVDIQVFQTFLLRFVRSFLDIKHIKFNTNYEDAFRRNISDFNKMQYAASIVSHLFNETDVYWFITIPSR
jgi:hypothetical protein